MEVTGGRFAAEPGSQEQEDLDIQLPLMMIQEEGDVPRNTITVGKEVVPKYNKYPYSIVSSITRVSPVGTSNSAPRTRSKSEDEVPHISSSRTSPSR